MLNRVLRAYRRHGFAKFWSLAARNAAYYLRRVGKHESPDPVGRSLDDALGIETTAIRETGSLAIESANVVHAVRYQPSDVDIVRDALRDCGIDYSRFVFVDFGCGKGRVMLLAAQYPFRRVLGVEFSGELHRIAVKNISASLPRLEGCKDVRAILGDATEFALPDDPLVCYFYNPFGEPVMRAVVGNIERSLRERWRRVFVIYVEPVHRQAFDDSRWKLVRSDSRLAIYESRE